MKSIPAGQGHLAYKLFEVQKPHAWAGRATAGAVGWGRGARHVKGEQPPVQPLSPQAPMAPLCWPDNQGAALA